ncbi:MAG: iron-containing redox enzyme family protein [Myxococcales bacterium]|nr:iron-containing redox enzyme family protein [Myxococcales bacterium]
MRDAIHHSEPLRTDLRPARVRASAPSERVEALEAGPLHVQLATLNRARLSPAEPSADWTDDLQQQYALARLEGAFLEQERQAVASRAAAAPREAHAFAAWFDALEQDGPGQHDPLFDYLAQQATEAEVQWFLTQELATEAGFEDLVALTQLRMPTQVKLELARNYWDEMGRGKAPGMHGPMLDTLAKALGVRMADPRQVVWESLALSNLLVGLAYNRRFAYQSLGALGAIELTAPSRARKVVEGLERLGVDGVAARYFRLHAVVDVRHAQTWRDEILIPLVTADPGLAVHLAEGALMRLRAGARTFERYRRHLGVKTPAPRA